MQGKTTREGIHCTVRAGLQGGWELVVCSNCSAEDSKSCAFKIAVDDMLDELMTPRVPGAVLSEYTEVSVHGLIHKQEKNIWVKNCRPKKTAGTIFLF